jgi:hypothetical protein
MIDVLQVGDILVFNSLLKLLMNFTTSSSGPEEPTPGYWHDRAVEKLNTQDRLKPGPDATHSEKRLWARLVELQAAAYAVLSDVDDDGVAEAHDMAILGLRNAVNGKSRTAVPTRPSKRILTIACQPVRQITAR